MKLLKLSEEHYIIADKVDIKVGDWITDKYSVWQWKDDSSLLGRLKVTHSTEPLEEDITYRGVVKKPVLVYWSINQIAISEVKELLGEVDVDRKADEANGYALYGSPNGEKYLAFREGFVIGYNQAIKDNKYTKEDMLRAYREGENVRYSRVGEAVLEKQFIQSLQPKTEWDVEFVDNKLKLK